MSAAKQLQQKINQIVLLGTNRNEPEQSQAVKAVNLMSTLSFTLISLQIPIQLALWSDFSANQLILVFAHMSMLTLVPQFNRWHKYCAARLYLIATVSSYVAFSSFNFGFMTEVHYFFLIAIFAVPFMQFHVYSGLTVVVMLYFMTLFLVWELLLVTPSIAAPAATHSPVTEFVNLSQQSHISFAICCLLVGYLLFLSNKSCWQRVRREQIRSERLLVNILPRNIAGRLNKNESPIADHFDNVTILFADIVGFSTLTRRCSATTLVSLLNDLFCRFDAIASRYQIEKIKTIGDQYMTAAGLHGNQTEHACDTCRCAIHMQKEFALWAQQHQLNVSLRIGINTGAVVAGVIGTHKFSYDLWGDAVNLASRMESHGQPGKIQVSEATYRQLQGRFPFEYRKTIEVKGLGKQNVYWLDIPGYLNETFTTG